MAALAMTDGTQDLHSFWCDDCAALPPLAVMFDKATPCVNGL